MLVLPAALRTLRGLCSACSGVSFPLVVVPMVQLTASGLALAPRSSLPESLCPAETSQLRTVRRADITAADLGPVHGRNESWQRTGLCSSLSLPPADPLPEGCARVASGAEGDLSLRQTTLWPPRQPARSDHCGQSPPEPPDLSVLSPETPEALHEPGQQPELWGGSCRQPQRDATPCVGAFSGPAVRDRLRFAQSISHARAVLSLLPAASRR